MCVLLSSPSPFQHNRATRTCANFIPTRTIPFWRTIAFSVCGATPHCGWLFLTQSTPLCVLASANDSKVPCAYHNRPNHTVYSAYVMQVENCNTRSPSHWQSILTGVLFSVYMVIVVSAIIKWWRSRVWHNYTRQDALDSPPLLDVLGTLDRHTGMYQQATRLSVYRSAGWVSWLLAAVWSAGTFTAAYFVGRWLAFRETLGLETPESQADLLFVLFVYGSAAVISVLSLMFLFAYDQLCVLDAALGFRVYTRFSWLCIRKRWFRDVGYPITPLHHVPSATTYDQYYTNESGDRIARVRRVLLLGASRYRTSTQTRALNTSYAPSKPL